MRKEILDRFSFHKPDEKGISQMRMVRLKVRELAHLIVMMSANSAIVQAYPVDPSELPVDGQDELPLNTPAHARR
jgi:hypothetical protein